MLRLLDANFDRIGEGLRVLEEVARFLLNDAGLCQRLKALRHNLVKGELAAETGMVSARDVAGDAGAFTRLPEANHRDLAALIAANSRRVQESIRVLEEFARLPDTPLKAGPEDWEKRRYELYDLERQLMSRVLRRDKQSRLKGLYVIVDTGALEGRDALDVAAGAIRGGASVIQLRDKMLPRRELIDLARKIKGICAESGALFVVNDCLDVALAAEADGLHVGQEDMPVAEARRLLPFDRLIGRSTHGLEEALRAEADGADYIAVGSIYPTPSKEKCEVIGLESLRQIRARVSLPVVAIGGITCQNLDEVMRAGADGVAVISAVLHAANVERAAREMTNGMRPIC